MPKPTHVRLRGAPARVASRMVRHGKAMTADEAVELALLEYGRREGLVDETDLLRSLQKEAAQRPLSDGALAEGIRRATHARVP
jgi:hypothetical protein